MPPWSPIAYPGQSQCHTHANPLLTNPCASQRVFQEGDWQNVTSGSLKLVNQATPWINSFVLVEGKDKLWNLKLRICLDLTNLNKAIVHKPYHFKIPEDIAHLVTEACVIAVCDCRRGYWHQQIDGASSFLTMFNTELGRFWYTVIPFQATVAGDIFQRNLMSPLASWSKLLLSQMTSLLLGTSQTTVIMTKPSLACYKQPRCAMSNWIMKSCNTSRIG